MHTCIQAYMCMHAFTHVYVHACTRDLRWYSVGDVIKPTTATQTNTYAGTA